MRFRTGGTNWEGRPWELAPCLTVLAGQIEISYPARHPADGTVASKNHDKNNPSSDHRPHPYTGRGVVRGLDAGESHEDDAYAVSEAIRVSRDRRVKYVIHEARMYSSYGSRAWQWRAYTGPAPHSDHFHISTLPEFDHLVNHWSIGDDDMAWMKPGDPILDLEDADAVFEYQGDFAPGPNQASYNPSGLEEANDRLWIVFARMTDWAMRNGK